MTDAEAEVALGHLFADLDRSGRTELLLLPFRNQHAAGLKLLTGTLETHPVMGQEQVMQFAYRQGELNGIKRMWRKFEELADTARKLREPQG